MEEDCSWVDLITFPTAYIENNNILGDINGDGTINIQDIVITVNMVIGSADVNLIADMNSDGAYNVLGMHLNSSSDVWELKRRCFGVSD